MTGYADRPDRRCGATNRQGERCGNLAIRGARVCRIHGGSVKRTKAAAARREVERKATDALRRSGMQPVGNPLEELQKLASEVVHLKNYLGGRVEKLEELRYQAGAGEQIRGELAAYERALDRSVRVLGDIARLGIDDRLVAINEATMAAYTEHAYSGMQFALAFMIPERFRAATVRVIAHVLRSRGPEGVPAPTGETAEHLARWQQYLAGADRVPELEQELAMVRRELEAVQAHRDRLRLALASRGSVPPLEIEAAAPVVDVLAGEMDLRAGR